VGETDDPCSWAVASEMGFREWGGKQQGVLRHAPEVTI